jgi:predicted permease
MGLLVMSVIYLITAGVESVSYALTFVIFQFLIIVPFIAGHRMKSLMADPPEVSKKVIRVNLMLLEPPVIFWSIWGLRIRHEMVVLPVAGLCIVIAGFFLGRLSLPLLRLEGTARKTYLISASLANHGFTMGGFICYLFMKETGLALSSIFLIYFMPYTFLAIFSYAQAGPGKLTLRSARDFILSYRNMPLFAALAALSLLAAGIPRPRLDPPVDLLMMLSIVLYYWTLGLGFSMRDGFALTRGQFALAAIKFLLVPAIVFLLLYGLPIGQDIKSVIQIQSFMPAAIYSVVTAILFDLDARLASSLFVVNTVMFIVVVLPVMFALHGAGLF